jgi:magnesium chelatase family protein
MLFKTLSAAVYGIDANVVEVEVDVSGIRTTEDHLSPLACPTPPSAKAASASALL